MTKKVIAVSPSLKDTVVIQIADSDRIDDTVRLSLKSAIVTPNHRVPKLSNERCLSSYDGSSEDSDYGQDSLSDEDGYESCAGHESSIRVHQISIRDARSIMMTSLNKLSSTTVDPEEVTKHIVHSLLNSGGQSTRVTGVNFRRILTRTENLGIFNLFLLNDHAEKVLTDRLTRLVTQLSNNRWSDRQSLSKKKSVAIMITGPHGSGKTALMRYCQDQLSALTSHTLPSALINSKGKLSFISSYQEHRNKAKEFSWAFLGEVVYYLPMLFLMGRLMDLTISRILNEAEFNDSIKVSNVTYSDWQTDRYNQTFREVKTHEEIDYPVDMFWAMGRVWGGGVENSGLFKNDYFVGLLSIFGSAILTICTYLKERIQSRGGLNQMIRSSISSYSHFTQPANLVGEYLPIQRVSEPHRYHLGQLITSRYGLIAAEELNDDAKGTLDTLLTSGGLLACGRLDKPVNFRGMVMTSVGHESEMTDRQNKSGRYHIVSLSRWHPRSSKNLQKWTNIIRNWFNNDPWHQDYNIHELSFLAQTLYKRVTTSTHRHILLDRQLERVVKTVSFLVKSQQKKMSIDLIDAAWDLHITPAVKRSWAQELKHLESTASLPDVEMTSNLLSVNKGYHTHLGVLSLIRQNMSSITESILSRGLILKPLFDDQSTIWSAMMSVDEIHQLESRDPFVLMIGREPIIQKLCLLADQYVFQLNYANFDPSNKFIPDSILIILQDEQRHDGMRLYGIGKSSLIEKALHKYVLNRLNEEYPRSNKVPGICVTRSNQSEEIKFFFKDEFNKIVRQSDRFFSSKRTLLDYIPSLLFLSVMWGMKACTEHYRHTTYKDIFVNYEAANLQEPCTFYLREPYRQYDDCVSPFNNDLDYANRETRLQSLLGYICFSLLTCNTVFNVMRMYHIDREFNDFRPFLIKSPGFKEDDVVQIGASIRREDLIGVTDLSQRLPQRKFQPSSTGDWKLVEGNFGFMLIENGDEISEESQRELSSAINRKSFRLGDNKDMDFCSIIGITTNDSREISSTLTQTAHVTESISPFVDLTDDTIPLILLNIKKSVSEFNGLEWSDLALIQLLKMMINPLDKKAIVVRYFIFNFVKEVDAIARLDNSSKVRSIHVQRFIDGPFKTSSNSEMVRTLHKELY